MRVVVALLVLSSACSTTSAPAIDVGVAPDALADDAGVLVSDAPSIDAGAPGDAGSSTSPVERVVVIGIDGLGGDWVTGANAPTLVALGAAGTWTNAMQNALPTTSSTNWMSMISGAHPELH